MTSTTTPMATGVTPERLRGLRRWNIGLAIIHLGSAAVILFLTNDFSIPVLASFIDGAPGSGEGGGATALVTSDLFNVTIGYVVGAFLALAGIDHLLTATIGRRIYERDLGRGINRFRWAEYSVSATLMVLVIALYWGVTTINALVVIAGANVAMILFGYLQERMNPPGRTSTTMAPFWFGSLVGITPWVAMALNIPLYTDAPEYIFVILAVQGVFFFCFGLTQWLQYKEIGPWANYAFGEKTYLVLSLAAKSLLAWNVFLVSLIS
ncbi:heliorhodopsin HeR [Cryobacterium sp. SO1]|uniref:heliorhodopsin HeR n=1 Tax=Cryobacterium sp. SO1 TaxID=1897061 RepID=UPI00210E3E00|nr:heliorhodopsin HeR [Cryobacterium sp. SO1]